VFCQGEKRKGRSFNPLPTFEDLDVTLPKPPWKAVFGPQRSLHTLLEGHKNPQLVGSCATCTNNFFLFFSHVKRPDSLLHFILMKEIRMKRLKITLIQVLSSLLLKVIVLILLCPKHRYPKLTNIKCA
jgi:hypothetical protein